MHHAHPFGETQSLQAVFHEAVQHRKVRHPTHVMVVEDDTITRRLLTGAFKESFAMLPACDAEEAVTEYMLHAPDIVFLDIGLPNIDGFAVLEHMIAVDPEAFVVMVSSHDDPEIVDRAFAAGAKGFVPKPFQKDVLRRFILGSAIHHGKHYG